MKRIVVFGLGMVAGLVLAFGLGGIGFPVAAQGGGAGAQGISNGDVNGDGQLNLTDAIYLLNHLFQSGPEPVLIECSAPPRAKFRLLNGLACANAPFPALLTFCNGSATDSTDPEDAPSACIDFDVKPTCSARLDANTNDCGPIELCGDINPVEGHVYDFLLTVDQGTLLLAYFDQVLDKDGACPPFAPPNLAPSGVFVNPCAGAPAGAGAGAQAFQSTGR